MTFTRPLTLAALLALLAAAVGAPVSHALPTPGFFCDTSEPVVGRLFPEPEQTNDFVGYFEAKCGLEKLAKDHPDKLKLNVAAHSVGWDNLQTGQRDTFEVWVVELTNFKTNLTLEQKPKILFQLSIHGNEKGGREGGLRVIEDFATGQGLAAAHPELAKLLDYYALLFVFPNPDGWVHEEAPYRANSACYTDPTCVNGPGKPGTETQNFVRVNGNGFDLNRNTPTVGWVREGYKPLSQPEQIGLVNWLKNYTDIRYASDIHGMLNPADGDTAGCVNPFAVLLGQLPDPAQCSAVDGNPEIATKGHFVLTMLPAGRFTPQEVVRSTSLAERVKESLNGDPYFAEWKTLPTTGAWGGEYNDWGTVWDTIGYTDSGFTSDFYAQDQGLNAMGVDFEMAYNHITFDNYYPGLAQRINMYHVQTVRDIVKSFMEQAALDVKVSIETNGHRTMVVNNPTVVTNANNKTVTGWSADTATDDAFDIAHRVFEAGPQDYWTDLKDVLRDGEKPGILDVTDASKLSADSLKNYDTLVIAGSAYDQVKSSPSAMAAVKTYVANGGHLFLSDSAMRMLVDLGIVSDGAVDKYFAYAGATNFVKKDDPLAKGLRGLARMTVEPVPVGFSIQGDHVPVWYVNADAFKGSVVGIAGDGQAFVPNAGRVDYGSATLGKGQVSFLGALLPDPSEEFYHPYGLDSYATTYTANQLVRNALGWDEKFTAPPVILTDIGKETTATAKNGKAGTSGATNAPKKSPIPDVLAPMAMAAAALVAIALERKRRA